MQAGEGLLRSAWPKHEPAGRRRSCSSLCPSRTTRDTRAAGAQGFPQRDGNFFPRREEASEVISALQTANGRLGRKIHLLQATTYWWRPGNPPQLHQHLTGSLGGAREMRDSNIVLRKSREKPDLTSK